MKVLMQNHSVPSEQGLLHFVRNSMNHKPGELLPAIGDVVGRPAPLGEAVPELALLVCAETLEEILHLLEIVLPHGFSLDLLQIPPNQNLVQECILLTK